MNRNTLLGWTLLMGVVLLWFTFKSQSAQDARKRTLQQQQVDSLAKANAGAAARAGIPGNGTDTGSQPALKQYSVGEPNATTTTGSSSLSGKGPASTPDSTALAASQRFLTVETNRFVVKLDNQGAKVASLSVKDLAGKRPYSPLLISPEPGGALLLSLDNQDLGKTIWQVSSPDSMIKVAGDSVSITFTCLPPGVGGSVSRTYTFFPDSGLFRHRLRTAGSPATYALQWPSGLSETEKIPQGKGFGLTSSFYSEVVLDNGITVQRTSFVGEKTFNAESGALKWVGLRRKYVAAVINFEKETTNKVVATGVMQPDQQKGQPHDYRLQISGSNYEDKALDFDFVVLPLSYDGLLAHHQNYEKIIFSGWEWFFRADVWYVALCGMVLHLLNFFHGLVPNYGVAIILLTLLVRTITLPLTVAQTKSAAKMQEHAPAIRKIRDKFKGNPQKANAEVMAYYKKVGVSPFAGVMGCFPALLQMPIFISLFNVLGRAVELKGAPFFGWIKDLSYPDVVMPGVQVDFIFPLGLTVLPFFMAASMFFQMKMTIKDPNQKFMVWMMPVMMFVFSCSFPSGLVLYWTVSNVFTIGQTYFYTNRKKKPVLGVVEGSGDKA